MKYPQGITVVRTSAAEAAPTIELRRKHLRITGKAINSLRLCVSAFSAINLLIQLITQSSLHRQRKKNLLAFQLNRVTRRATFIGGDGKTSIQADIPVMQGAGHFFIMHNTL